jgi:hypothetical protein
VSNSAYIQIASIVLIGILIGIGPGYVLPDKSIVVEVPMDMEEMHDDAAGHQEVSETSHQEGGHAMEGMQMTEEAATHEETGPHEEAATADHHEEATTDSGGHHH